VRAIIKVREPQSLTQHRLTQHCDFNNYKTKDELRQALVDEQRGLCCYCMTRIRSDPTSMKVEHWQCQSRYSSRQLDYQNLLGACLGGHSQPIHLQHCDTRKGDFELKWNAAVPAHQIEARIRYELDGTIRSDDSDFDNQLNEVLNLNLSVLKNSRKQILSAVLEWWKLRKSKLQGPVPREEIQREIRKRIDGTDDLQPFCQIAVWWLKKKL
jgi:uncharacterized protein (TIGR02646 family)